MRYLLFFSSGAVEKVKKLSEDHYEACQEGSLQIVDTETMTTYADEDWEEIPVSSDDLLPRDEEDSYFEDEEVAQEEEDPFRLSPRSKKTY
jgi:hypothetical protein